MKVKVESVVDEARDVRTFRLVSLDGSALPDATPGAHIDVWTPGGPVRQYSLCSPEARDGYPIAVKLEHPRGGSAAMHRVNQGDVLQISVPRNTFPLSEDARGHLLVAGGIGITPIVAMARHLATTQAAFELHYFARSRDHMAFYSAVTGSQLGKFTQLYLGLDPDGTAVALNRLIGDHELRERRHLYCCGPTPLMDATKNAALALGWPTDSLHEERFTATPMSESSDAGFRVVLARSGQEVDVNAEETVLDAVTRAGIDVNSSCEQGICGTCLTGVVAGEIDHRDHYLTDKEKAEGDRMCLCVSRSRSPQLVLDL